MFLLKNKAPYLFVSNSLWILWTISCSRYWAVRHTEYLKCTVLVAVCGLCFCHSETIPGSTVESWVKVVTTAHILEWVSTLLFLQPTRRCGSVESSYRDVLVEICLIRSCSRQSLYSWYSTSTTRWDWSFTYFIPSCSGSQALSLRLQYHNMSTVKLSLSYLYWTGGYILGLQIRKSASNFQWWNKWLSWGEPLYMQRTRSHKTKYVYKVKTSLHGVQMQQVFS